METNPQKHSIKESVLAKIKAGRTQAHSRAYFVGRIVLAVVVGLLALLVTAFLFNVVMFHVIHEGQYPLVTFGVRGFFLFLLFIPWPLVLFDILLLFALHRILRTFRFGYRTPVINTLLVLLALAISLSLLIYRETTINDALAHHARRGEFPGPVGSFFIVSHRLPGAPGGLVRGVVVRTGSSSMIIKNDEFGTTTVYTVTFGPDAPPLPPFMPGDMVYVAGQPDGSSTIQAFGVREDTDDLPPPPF